MFKLYRLYEFFCFHGVELWRANGSIWLNIANMGQQRYQASCGIVVIFFFYYVAGVWVIGYDVL